MKQRIRQLIKHIVKREHPSSSIGELVVMNLKLNSARKQLDAMHRELTTLRNEAKDPMTMHRLHQANSYLRAAYTDLFYSQPLHDYGGIDPLISPLCDALNDAGYMTIASCSGHVGAFSSKLHRMPFYKKQWYVLFYPTRSLDPLRQALSHLRRERGWPLECERFSKESHDPLVLYRMQLDITQTGHRVTDDHLELLNRTITQTIRKSLSKSNDRNSQGFFSYSPHKPL